MPVDHHLCPDATAQIVPEDSDPPCARAGEEVFGETRSLRGGQEDPSEADEENEDSLEAETAQEVTENIVEVRNNKHNLMHT